MLTAAASSPSQAPSSQVQKRVAKPPVIAGALTVQLLEDPAQLAAITDECERLASVTRPHLPFTTPQWLLHWWQHFRENRALVRDRFFVHTLRDERGTLIALAPLMLTERPAKGLLRLRSISFFGADRNITELRGLICAPEHEALAARALLAHLTEHSAAWDSFAWDGLRQGGEAYEMLDALPNFAWTRETTDHVLELPRTWSEFRATRPRNAKEALRKCYNSLARDEHVFDFCVVSDADELPAALERFFSLHRERAQAPELKDHPDYFARACARELLYDLARTPERVPALRAFELRVAGEVVASRLGFLLGDELYLYFSGFDPAWARYSVMTTTVAEAIKWAIEHGLNAVNLSAGTDFSKTRWRPSVITTCGGTLISPNASSALKWRLATSLHRASHRLRWLSRLLGGALRSA